jgi:hypothetical protein
LEEKSTAMMIGTTSYQSQNTDQLVCFAHERESHSCSRTLRCAKQADRCRPYARAAQGLCRHFSRCNLRSGRRDHARHREALSVDIEAAIAQDGSSDGVTAIDLAWHIQAVLQGAFIMAKAANDAELARDTVMHLKRYVAMLFGRGERICPT